MLPLQPRVSMIVGIDSKGEIFLSLTQSNSNSEIMELFFSELIRTLDRLRPGWKRTHLLLVDGASYHRSKKILTFFENHQLPIMYTGSYSYDAGKSSLLVYNLTLFTAPCELFFSAFKRADINPRHVP